MLCHLWVVRGCRENRPAANRAIRQAPWWTAERHDRGTVPCSSWGRGCGIIFTKYSKCSISDSSFLTVFLVTRQTGTLKFPTLNHQAGSQQPWSQSRVMMSLTSTPRTPSVAYTIQANEPSRTSEPSKEPANCCHGEIANAKKGNKIC